MKVRFCSRAKAEAMQPDADTIVISITDPEKPLANLKDGWKAVGRWQFHDVVHPQKNITFPAMRHAVEIIRFVDKYNKYDVLVHCEMGISRSAAIALALQKDGYELVNKQDEAGFANPRMLGLFSCILGKPIEPPAAPRLETLIW